jgi:hypothetical protein
VPQVAATAAAAKHGNLKQGAARKRPRTLSGKTAAAKAKVLNISSTTVERVERVAREAPHRLPEIESGRPLRKRSSRRRLRRSGCPRLFIRRTPPPRQVTDQMLAEERHLLLDKIGKTRYGQVLEFADKAKSIFQAAQRRATESPQPLSPSPD